MSAQPLEIRMAHLEGAYEQIAERLTGIDRRLDSFEHKMEARFTQIDGRFGQIESRFIQIDGRFAQIDRKFMWLIGLGATAWVSTMLAVLLHR
ncbi:MAG TPA: hypothetical protein VMW12_00965 [Candidatus Dormibacteraeota bacterium]|nr:hypothetical protein [Candidatus Dormibacteraeota bacterium]